MPRRNDIKNVMIIGSGPIVIGQACEFDYSGTQACKALRNLGYKIVLVNSNPATIMTDPGMADVTYLEPLTVESLAQIIEKERPDAVLPNLGGQTGLNLTAELHKQGVLEKYGVQIIGVQADAIERGEDRIAFKETMNALDVPMPESAPALSVWEELELEVVRDAKNQKITVCFIENVDAMGVHTGDSYCVAPMLTIAKDLQEQLQEISYRIVEAIGVIGGTNIQFAHDPGDRRGA